MCLHTGAGHALDCSFAVPQWGQLSQESSSETLQTLQKLRRKLPQKGQKRNLASTIREQQSQLRW